MEIGAHNELRCPDCSSALRLEPFLTEHQAGRDYVTEGVLLCKSCRVLYPIEANTPVMLRFSTRFHDWFASVHRSELRPFSDDSLPSGEPRRGEEARRRSKRPSPTSGS